MDHDYRKVLAQSDRALVVQKGQVVLHGNAEDVASSAALAAILGCETAAATLKAKEPYHLQPITLQLNPGLSGVMKMVRETGLEPVRHHCPGILSPVRLPITPLSLVKINSTLVLSNKKAPLMGLISIA